mmetsp:Transcript_15163/g.18035  ORF Transcript_15163/g.18035 Transcript_15163/m.18035 type:complete len:216 (-) Transcript_15163:2692-3339(-)
MISFVLKLLLTLRNLVFCDSDIPLFCLMLFKVLNSFSSSSLSSLDRDPRIGALSFLVPPVNQPLNHPCASSSFGCSGAGTGRIMEAVLSRKEDSPTTLVFDCCTGGRTVVGVSSSSSSSSDVPMIASIPDTASMYLQLQQRSPASGSPSPPITRAAGIPHLAPLSFANITQRQVAVSETFAARNNSRKTADFLPTSGGCPDCPECGGCVDRGGLG